MLLTRKSSINALSFYSSFFCNVGNVVQPSRIPNGTTDGVDVGRFERLIDMTSNLDARPRTYSSSVRFLGHRALSKKGQLFSQPFSPIMERRSIPRGYRRSAPAAEAIVDAGHDKVGIAGNAVGGKYQAAGYREVRGAVIEEQVVVLDPDRPIRGKAIFETDANRGTPTGVGVTRRNNRATKEDVIAVVDNRGAALNVEQSVVPGVSYLAGEQAEGVHPGPINESGEQEAHVVAAKIGPVTLCFEAKHPTAGLPAVADLTTDDAATRFVTALGHGTRD
jgi:hypothetical protein